MSAQGQRLGAVTNHASSFIQRWCVSLDADAPEHWTAQVLIAAGRGSARIPTCEEILRNAAPPPVLVCALSLLRTGELRALHVADLDAFGDLVASAFDLHSPERLYDAEALSPDRLNALRAALLSQPIQSLHIVGWSEPAPTVALINQHATSLTELDCPVPFKCDAAGDAALAACTRLQSLTFADRYTPAAWLGLSQLHTLRGVDLAEVPMSSIAAALPRLHTLDCFIHDGHNLPTAVAGFFEDLVPRLRAFQFHGEWPSHQGEGATSDATHVKPQPLPQLQQLTWWERSNHHPVMRRFMGAQPTRLRLRLSSISEFFVNLSLIAGCNYPDGALSAFAPQPFWGRLREFSVDVTTLSAADVARVLRVAPQLRVFNAEVWQRDDPFWLTVGDGKNVVDAAFAGLMHPQLRQVTVNAVTLSRNDDDDQRNVDGGRGRAAGGGMPADCAVQLRQLHFPRLQRLVVDREDYPATPMD